MNTYTCPRCGQRSTPAQCPSCGRGPEPLLARLDELDTALRVISHHNRSRAAVEAERLEVLEALGRLAESYRNRTAASPSAPAPTTGPTPAPPGPATPPPPPPPRARPEMGAKAVQTLLLGLGGLLVAAAIVIFTAVAWRHLGDAGRLAILTGFTALLLGTPVALLRFGLRATAETFGALASLALWCSALAGYYLLLPGGASLTAEAVGTWTMLVLAALAAYRAAVPVAATGWAMLPLAAIGASFAAVGETINAALLMLGTATVLASAAWVAAHRPSHYRRSEPVASRLLLCAAVVLAFLAGLRVAFGLSDPLVPVVAAAVALLAAGNLLATVYARRAGATTLTTLIAWAATGSLAVAAWVLSIRAGEAELTVPSLALLGALIAALVGELDRSESEPGLLGGAVAAIAGLASLAIVAVDAPDLTSYLGASAAAAAIALAVRGPLHEPLRRAARIGLVAVAAAGAAIALEALPVVWWDVDPFGPYTWEVPIVLALTAFAAALVPRVWRIDVVAFAATFAAVGAAGLLWHEVSAPQAAVPVLGFTFAAAVALATALASATMTGRCTSWVMLAVWLPVTAAAIGSSPHLGADALQLGFALTGAAAAMLMIAAGARRRTRADRVLGAILAHVLAGTTVAVMLGAEWIAELIASSGSVRLLPAAIGAYTLALAGVSVMAPAKRRAYAIAALCTGTLAWWTLLASYSVTTLESFTGPPAALLFGIGVRHLLRRPESGSWTALAAPVAVGLAPSLLAALGEDGEAARRVGVGAAALAVVIAGLARRWQAPLILGSAALAALTINELALLWHLIPQWIPPAVGGAILILAGATLEQRRRDLRRLSRSIRSMR
ncbi:SCO7613 C-terminal domain-containing membrane protein [Glycomyces xiaoerkulensis]|uniref:SCO7613 C-terminal domain-containing membrane protein n=1 Tax=Glycomyces xiaoerkulensis TaxID=2038139 RepID=UPI0012FFFD91|nr:hypothetical protein [Glycomyces xiaoerkulensis]